MNLLCDHMLGSLAKWLRILGCDTLYPDALTSDDEILIIAGTENRLLFSRDKALIQQAHQAHLPALLIHPTSLAEQLTQVLTCLQIDSSQFFSRCTICNTLLVSVEKAALKTQVPQKVFETREEFWFCPVCKKYYWMGTHYDNMMQRVYELQKNNHTLI